MTTRRLMGRPPRVAAVLAKLIEPDDVSADRVPDGPERHGHPGGAKAAAVIGEAAHDQLAHATFTPLSVGNFLIDLPLFCSARRNSYRFCRPSQNSALVPKKCASRSAVSPVIARCLFRIEVTRFVGTPSRRASSAALMSSSFSSSARCSPG